MHFTPVEQTTKWYRSEGAYPYEDTEIRWSASIHESTIESNVPRWRPVVEFTYGFTATLSVRTPDYATYATVADAGDWVQLIVANRSFAHLLMDTVNITNSMTASFNAAHPEPSEDSDAQPDGS